MKKLIASVFILFSIVTAWCIAGMVSTTLDCYFPEKYNNTPTVTIQKLSPSKSVCKKQYFMVIPCFAGCAVDKDSICNVVYDIKILKPDGSVYLDNKDLIAQQTETTVDNNISLTSSILKICFEEPDPYGTYKIYITMRDLVAKQEIELQTKIKLVKTKYQKTSFNDKMLETYMPDYYKDPKPEKVISSYLYCAKSKALEKQAAMLPFLAFYKGVLDQNEYLIPLIYDLYPKQNDYTKMCLLLLLRYLQHDSSAFTATLPYNQKAVYDTLLKSEDYFQFDKSELSQVYQLDILWTEFYATGSVEYIKSLVNALDYVDFLGNVDKYETSARTDEDKSKAMKEIIYKSAFWSIRIHYHTHQLVHDYIDFMYQNATLSDKVKVELGKIINEKPADN